ncbi:SCO7613 C-terminal domain-containing membrane protein [Quadrisphaera sp. KR29]|uniref:SCO7613 C-terminal domain-containing membrane protein n=1 Tax=Quadrisphaera sp. KR29 TaxID=3461391 RepID=UPI00404441C0
MSDAQHAPPPQPGCPRCAAPLVPGSPACAACGLRLVGEDAAELWELDQQLALLGQRRAALLASLAGEADSSSAQAPAAAATAVGAASSAWAPPTAATDPYATAAATDPYATTAGTRGRPGLAAPAGPAPVPVPRQRRFGAQQLLLVTGVVLVAVAAIAFTAYVWGAIGALGQALVLVVVCAGAALASRATARRELGASAEALAVLSVLVLLVLLGAARGLDVLGLGATDADAYQLGALLVAVGACAAGDRWLRPATRPARPVAPAWAAVLLTAAVPTSLALAVGGELLTWSAAALVLAVLSAPASRLLGARAPGLGAAGLVVGAAHLVAGVLVLLAVDVGADAVAGSGPDASAPYLAALELALLALAAAWTASRAGRPAPGQSAAGQPGPARALLAGRPQLRRTAVVVAYGGVIGALVSLAAAGGAFALLLLALGVSATTAVLLAVRPRLLPWPVLVSALALAGGSLLSEPVVGSAQDTWWRPAAWYALAGAALLAGGRRPVASAPGPVLAGRRALPLPRSLWAAAGSVAALGGALAAPSPVSGVLPVVLALAAATVLLGLSALVRGAPEAVLSTGWALVSLAALVMADGGPVLAAVPLGVAGLGALLRAGDPRRTAWTVPAAVLLSAAWWDVLDRVAPPGADVEWWSLPPAALALALGALVWQRHPRLGSWLVLGPGLAAALLPSALEAAAGGSPWRTGLVAVAGAVVCGAGVRWALQAPVVLGAAAALVVAVGQLGPYALQAPVWVGLFLAGAVVLVLAVRIEQARRDAARAVGWVRALR